MKKISIGITDFKEIINNNYYLVDKSLFIKEIMEDGSKVLLIPRPRRFGKTINMSMLKYFFEKTDEDNSFLFKELYIYKCKDVMEKQGKYPVIYLTFKDEKYLSWKDCKSGMKFVIGNEFKRHKYLLKSNIMDDEEKETYKDIMNLKADDIYYHKSLLSLSMYLSKHYNEKTVIIIDEYDVPIQGGYTGNYYEDIINFMRNFLSGGLKDNIYLEKAILTGILRVAKESIFSGLNNLNVYSILKNKYSSYFGFSEVEIEEIFKYYEVEFKLDEVKSWYNGYVFGENVIYNPWCILNYVNNYEEGLQPYWINTSSNDLVKSLITKGGHQLKSELEDLIQDKSITKEINENIEMKEIDKSTENVWSFLLLSGYLKTVKNTRKPDGRLVCELAIPNIEVKYLYNEIIMSWLKESVNNDEFNLMLNSLTNGDIENFEDIFADYVVKSFSYFDIGDESENFYHAFVLGILVALNNKYRVKSNRESGYGRYDIMIIPKDIGKNGIIIEFKKVNKRRKETLNTAAENALAQIKTMNYRQELIELRVKNIIELGIAFEGKDVFVLKSSDS
ncbi:AAA family ATPase [Clostridium drakei]|uniref:AAA family ATPase n=4 Tax=Clostridium drakei TaxID=332101 RepID=A0A2U8DUL9_9CLOT|nr:AAA family ATPase [Clostridium drakei]AWI05762.1 AAA family ATPase [Clostridium drakei]